MTEAQKNNFSGYAERIHNLVRDNMPQHRPAVLPHILTDEMNGFWAGYESVYFEEIRWLYIASTGQITKELYLPSRYRPHAITGNLMVGIQTESDGSQSINGFKINPS